MAGGYEHRPTGAPALAARVARMNRQADANRRALTGLGIQIDPATKALVVGSGRGINLQGGDLTANGGNVESGNFAAGSAGWRLQPNGNVEFNDLTLRGGIIGNDALASPATFGVYNGIANATLVATTGLLELTHGFIAVPAGYTQAVVMCTVVVGGTNSTGVKDYLYASAAVQNAYDISNAQGMANGYAGSVTSTRCITLTGLTAGSSIRVSSYAATDTAGWTGGNGHIAAMAVFLR